MRYPNDQPVFEEHDNSICTFEVRVRFMRNATWQGDILWAEKNKKQYFRSFLEMTRLMDEAVSDSFESQEPVKWKKDETD